MTMVCMSLEQSLYVDQSGFSSTVLLIYLPLDSFDIIRQDMFFFLSYIYIYTYLYIGKPAKQARHP